MTDFEQKLFPKLTGGLNVSLPPAAIRDDQSPNVLNLRVDKGRLKIDFGYADQGSSVTGGSRLVYQFIKKSGSSEIILITNSRIYRWKSGEWQYVPSATTTVNNAGGYAAGSTTITVTDASSFADGDYIGVILDNGSEHQTTVDGAPAGNDVTITDAIPTGRSVPNGAAFAEAKTLSGDWSSPVTACTFPASDIMVFTNGKDDVQYYDGTTCQTVTNLVAGVGGGNCYAKIVRVADNKLILFNTNENGTDYPQRVRWCATGDYTDWTTSADAGYEDLYGSAGHITAAEELGPAIVVYKESSIIEMKYLGTSDFTYYFTTMLDSHGAASAWAIINRGNYHVVVDAGKGTYIYSGGYNTQEFGQEIFDEVFNTDGSLNKLYKYNIFAKYLQTLKKYILLLPTGDSSIPNYAYIFDEEYAAWTKRQFNDTVVGADEIDLVSGTTWTEASGDWNDGTWEIPWNDVSLISGTSGVYIWGRDSAIAGMVWKYDDDYSTDDGTSITGRYETPEILNSQGNIRIDRIKSKCKGTSITVEYSTDEGGSWTSYGTLTPGSSFSIESVYRQLVAERVMFKFTGTDLELEWIAVYWSAEDEE